MPFWDILLTLQAKPKVENQILIWEDDPGHKTQWATKFLITFSTEQAVSNSWWITDRDIPAFVTWQSLLCQVARLWMLTHLVQYLLPIRRTLKQTQIWDVLRKLKEKFLLFRSIEQIFRLQLSIGLLSKLMSCCQTGSGSIWIEKPSCRRRPSRASGKFRAAVPQTRLKSSWRSRKRFQT